MGFRVSLEMTKLYSDERSFSYIYIDETFQKIHDLESRIRDLFEVIGPFCLMSNNHLLPSPESILLLKEDQVITVVPIQSPLTRIKKFNETLFDPVASELNSSKSHEEVENVEKEAKKKKRKKNKESLQDPSAIELVEEHASLPSTTDNSIQSVVFPNPEVCTAIKNIEEYHLKQKKAEEEEVEAMKSKALNALKDFFPTNINGVSDGRIKKRKRIRIRKSKKSNQVEYLQSDSESNITQNNKSLVLTNGKKNSSHIRFTPADKPVTVLQNEIGTQKLSKTPRIVRALQPEMLASLNSPSASVSDTSNNFNGNSFEKNTNVEKSQKYFSDNIECSEPESNTDTLKNSQYQKVDQSLTSILKRVNTYPVESEMAVKDDDVIIFKMLKIGDDYTPTVSNHILGKVASYNMEDQSMKLTILDGHQECIEPSGKFQLEDELEEDSLPNYIDVAWGQLLEPRIIH